MVLKGLRDSPFFSHECVGYVSRVGAAVTKLQQGDIVITLSPGKLDTSFVVPEEFCHRLYSNQETADLIGFMTPSCIALLALRDYGRIRTGDVSSLGLLHTNPTSNEHIYLDRTDPCRRRLAGCCCYSNCKDPWG